MRSRFQGEDMVKVLMLDAQVFRTVHFTEIINYENFNKFIRLHTVFYIFTKLFLFNL